MIFLFFSQSNNKEELVLLNHRTLRAIDDLKDRHRSKQNELLIYIINLLNIMTVKDKIPSQTWTQHSVQIAWNELKLNVNYRFERATHVTCAGGELTQHLSLRGLLLN